MQNRGALWIFTILLALACTYQLSFSVFTSGMEKKARVESNLKADSVLAIPGNEGQDFRFQNVDAGVDEEMMHRFFIDAGQAVLIRPDHAVGHLEVILLDTDGCLGVMGVVKIEEMLPIDPGQHVAVHDDAGPFGSKGVGEPCTVPTPGAVANAIARVLGTRVRQLPATPERVWAVTRGGAT